MISKQSPPNALFRHAVLEGTACECGYTLGAHIREQAGVEYKLYTGQMNGCKELPAEQLEGFVRQNDRFCPGINDEMQGLADGLGVSLQRLAASLLWNVPSGFCSHMAVLPGATANGHVLAARSYEWSREDALCLVTTRVKGKLAHIGFSLFACGRFDGMNEKGLCVTMSAGAPGKKPTAGGFLFCAGIRAALDTCATVGEALELISAMPSCSYVNIILCDRQGNAALMEDACGHRAVKRIGPGSADQFLYSANHFTLPGMAELGDKPMWMSAARSSRMELALSTASPHVIKEGLKALLAARVPEGLSCHHYSDGFGTLWSMAFDVTQGVVDVSFGPPAVNSWRTFSLDDPAGITTYAALLPDEPCRDPKFFSKAFD
jgi:predicted choloylglycine hydrolase